MKKLLNTLSQPIEADIAKFNEVYNASLNSEVKLINTVIGYISRKKGKQLRPHLCLLAAQMCGGATESTYRAAALIEMIHVATLIHDDVVDDAAIRRGWPSVNRIWKNKISILVGDYMFSKALSNIIQLKNFDALKILSSTAERLSQGEIMQIEKAMKKEMTEDAYFKMVGYKTASLFSAACSIGAITANATPAEQQSMASFGEKLGIAFQIKDDLFDILGNVDGIGKPVGFDLKKNMLTLPLIHMFSSIEVGEHKKIQRQIKRYSKRKNQAAIKKMINNHGGIEYSHSQMESISNQALSELDQFSDSDYKVAMTAAVNFNLKRVL